MSNPLNATARQLAEPQDVSFQKALYNETFAGAHTLKLGLMLAQVAIRVNPSARAIGVQGFGDGPTLRAISATNEAGTLKISAPLPFVAEDSVTRSRSHQSSHGFQGNVFGGNVVGKVVGGFVSGGGMVISGSSISIGGGISVINGVVYYDGREVDMRRKILLVITVPSETSIKAKDMFGNIGIGGQLQGDLSVNASGESAVYAESVNAFRANFSGSCTAELGVVAGRLNADISGSGVVQASTARGEVNADISGSGRVFVLDPNSTSASVNADISGSGQFIHRGTVKGDVEFDISGSGYVSVTKALGDVDDSISGNGSADINGRRYTSRRGGW
jgi:hypothetical protein